MYSRRLHGAIIEYRLRAAAAAAAAASCHSFSFMYMNMNDMFSMLHSLLFFYDNSFLWCFIILTLSYHKVIHVRRLSISGWFHDVQKEKKYVCDEKRRGTKNRYLIEKLFSRRRCFCGKPFFGLSFFWLRMKVVKSRKKNQYNKISWWFSHLL